MDSSRKSSTRKRLGLQGRDAKPHYYKSLNAPSHQGTHNWPLSSTLGTSVPSARYFCFLLLCRWLIWAQGSYFSLVRFYGLINNWSQNRIKFAPLSFCPAQLLFLIWYKFIFFGTPNLIFLEKEKEKTGELVQCGWSYLKFWFNIYQ